MRLQKRLYEQLSLGISSMPKNASRSAAMQLAALCKKKCILIIFIFNAMQRFCVKKNAF
jgi:hypothetical protein